MSSDQAKHSQHGTLPLEAWEQCEHQIQTLKIHDNKQEVQDSEQQEQMQE